MDINTILGSISNLSTRSALRRLMQFMTAGPFVEINADAALQGGFLVRRFLVDSEAAVEITLPQMRGEYDGAEITFVKVNSGGVTVSAPAGVTVSDSLAAGSIANTTAEETWATLTLKYSHAKKAWYIMGIDGTWETT